MNNLIGSFGLRTAVATVFPDLFEGDYLNRNKSKEEIEMRKQLTEIWKPINGHKGLYEISNHGLIKSLARNINIGQHRVWKKEEAFLKGGISRGYRLVLLYKNGKRKTFLIHRLVWDHFGNSPRNGRKLQVDHIDNNKLNNRIDNLQLLTAKENTTKYHLFIKTSGRSKK